MACWQGSFAAPAGPCITPLSQSALAPSPSCRHATLRGLLSFTQAPQTSSVRDTAVKSSSTLTAKRCEPCESDSGSMGYMGLCGSLQKPQVEELLEEVRHQ